MCSLGLRAFSFCFVSQGRDLRLCLWDLAEGRNAVVDSVCLESVGFCRSSVLGVGQARWMLAVPGKGIDEVRPALLMPFVLRVTRYWLSLKQKCLSCMPGKEAYPAANWALKAAVCRHRAVALMSLGCCTAGFALA